MSGNGRLLLRGRPTGPQVKALMERFGDTPRGSVVKYQEIEATINEKRGEPRYQTVVSVWRRRMLREKHVVLEAQQNVGYEFLTASGQIRHAVRRIRTASRQTFKAAVEAEAAPPTQLAEHERRARDHMMTRTAAFAQELRLDRRQVSLMLGDGKERPEQ